jgi:hypothetical protein
VLFDTAELGIVVVVVGVVGTVVVVTGTVVVVVGGTIAAVMTCGVVSIVRLNEAPDIDVFPAASVRVAVTVHTPSDNCGRSQLDTDTDTTNEHVTVTPPLVAVTRTVSPTVRPEKPISGVLSDVMLSVDEVPRSEASIKSGIPGAVGATVSIVRLKEELVADVFPAASVRVAVTLHTPSDNNGKSQLDTDADATNEHVTVTPSFVALTSTVSPTVRPEKPISGVSSDVMLSVDDLPLSEDASKSGVDNADSDPTISI